MHTTSQNTSHQPLVRTFRLVHNFFLEANTLPCGRPLCSPWKPPVSHLTPARSRLAAGFGHASIQPLAPEASLKACYCPVALPWYALHCVGPSLPHTICSSKGSSSVWLPASVTPGHARTSVHSPFHYQICLLRKLPSKGSCLSHCPSLYYHVNFSSLCKHPSAVPEPKGKERQTLIQW